MAPLLAFGQPLNFASQQARIHWEMRYRNMRDPNAPQA
jgi:hypothetical protein